MNKSLISPSRRAAILGAATGIVSVAVGSEAADAAPLTNPGLSKNTTDCLEACVPVRCPKNGIISSLAVSDGQINEKQLICQVAFDDENRVVERLKLSQALLEVDAKALNEGQVKIRRRVLEIATEITAAYVQFAKAKYERDKAENELGVLSDLVLLQSATALTKANAENEKSQIALKNFDFNIQLMRERYELIKAQMPAEIDFVTSMIRRLEVHSPKAGKIRLLVGVGSFVSIGQPLAEIS